ncbi:hypothetical protein GF342_05790 [Candidatus Woesearchaeota archaeon]|nr:hypothetical protein [Candidatus Woesearchaeota archaeon]
MCEITDEHWREFDEGKRTLRKEFFCNTCKNNFTVEVHTREETAACPTCGSSDLDFISWHYS